jgi:putative transposase
MADAALLAVIDQVFAESRSTYGSPRVHAELRLGHSIRVGRKRVERLMRRAGLVAVSSRRRRGLTRRDPLGTPAPDLVDRDFTTTAPDQLWIADFTQIATWQGVAYIAVVADAYSRLCLGWRVRPDKTTSLVVEALEMAIWRRGQMRAAEAIHHSDHGSQYTSIAFTRRLKDAGITPSMGTVGDALDNAMCESLIGSMKIELLNRETWRTVDDVSIAVFEWLEAWYNRRRRHSALGYISPLEYEDQHTDGHQLTNP